MSINNINNFIYKEISFGLTLVYELRFIQYDTYIYTLPCYIWLCAQCQWKVQFTIEEEERQQEQEQGAERGARRLGLGRLVVVVVVAGLVRGACAYATIVLGRTAVPSAPCAAAAAVSTHAATHHTHNRVRHATRQTKLTPPWEHSGTPPPRAWHWRLLWPSRPDSATPAVLF